MITAIIVDDEEQSRYGIERFFDFEKYQISITGYASNGREALELIRREHHQLVITDVRMPVMDGIELCEALRNEFGDSIQVLFISAYDDLAYLHSAIKYGAVEYLTKPIDFDEFDQAMQRVSERIKKLNNSNDPAQVPDRLQQKKHYFASLLISNEWETPPQDLYVAPDAVYTPLLIRIANKTPEQFLTPLKSICEQLLKDVPDACVISLNSNDICVVYPSDKIDLLVVFSSKLQQQILSLLQIKTIIAVGEASTLKTLGSNYHSLVQYIDQKLIIEENDIILYAGNGSKLHSLSIDSQILDQLILGFKQTDKATITNALDSVFSGIARHPEAQLEESRIYLLQVFTHVINYLTEQGISSYIAPVDIMTLYHKMKELTSFSELKFFATSCMDSYYQLVAANQVDQTNQAIHHIKEYIASHYSEPITVREIANAVYLSTAYTCTLFKKETGKTLNNYLTIYRMKKAAEMLTNPQFKLYQISRAVGYSDTAYFVRQFRNFSGETPTEYRKQRLKYDQKPISESEHP